MSVRFSDVTIIGLGKSGMSAALFLLEQGSRVSVTDSSDDPSVLARASVLKKRSVQVEIGRHTRAYIHGRTAVIASPGVPSGSDPLRWAHAESIPVVGELELAYRFFPGRVIAVTGTNGKSTVTMLMGEVLKEAGWDVRVGGNLGRPFTELLSGTNQATIAVVEVSSFQLETIHLFRPWIALFLNIAPNHLDRYQDFEAYRAAKTKIFQNQTGSDWALVEERVLKSIRHPRACVRTFSSIGSRMVDPNAVAVHACAEIVGIPGGVVERVIGRFRGLEHRLEFAGEESGIRYVNDSKSTNTASTLWALERVEGPGVWILGGRDKGADFRELEPALKQKARGVVAMGEASAKIRDALSGSLTVVPAGTLKDAFGQARALACRGDSIVLSPACASFDEFTDFEERGRAFKALVQGAATRA